MQNTFVSTPTTAASQQTASVVQHDTKASSVPSIKLDSLKVQANVIATVPASTDNPAPAATPPQNPLVAMEQARLSWEKNEFAASNKRLYTILKETYSYYLLMKQDIDKNVRAAHLDELNQFCKQRNYSFMPTTHDMTRIVKSVFGLDRRRVSAYSLALREALRQEISAEGLVKFIEDEGGVEQIRLGGKKAMPTSDRAKLVKAEVITSDLGLIKFDQTVFAADADWADKQLVIVATYLPTGEFQANAVIQHDGVVNAALAAFYNNKQSLSRANAKAERDTEKASEKALKASISSRRRDAKTEKQHVSLKAEIAAAKQKAVFDTHVNTLFDFQKV